MKGEDSLSFDATIDDSDIDKTLAKITKGFEGIAKTAEKEGKKTDEAFSKMADGVTASNKKTKQSVEEVGAAATKTPAVVERATRATKKLMEDMADTATTAGRKTGEGFEQGANRVEKAAKKTGDSVRKLKTDVVKEASTINTTLSEIGSLAAGGLAAVGLAQLPGQIIKVRGEFQQLEISFNTMLGSAEKANKLLGEVTQFAALTPYGLRDTAAATKQLLAYGEGADTVISTLTKLGDIASGIGAPLGDIAYLYGTTMTQGRLYTQDLNQFTGRGIPMIKELAKVFGVAENEVRGLVEAGKVGFPEVQQAINNLTKEGSMFGGLMEAQSKSIPGLIAQLGDAFDMALNNIGKQQEGVLTDSIKLAIGVVENYEDIVDVLKVVIATYGAYRTALLVAAAAQNSAAISGAVANWFSYARSVKTATDAQTLFNLTVRANPYVVAFTALAALATGLYVFSNRATEASKAQERMAEATNQAAVEVAKETKNIESLRAQILEENRSRSEKETLLKKIIALDPKILDGLTLQNIATGRGTELINDYIKAKREQIRVSTIQAKIDENIQKMQDIRSGKNDSDFGPSAFDRAARYLAAAESGQTGQVEKQLEQETRKRREEALKGLRDYNAGLMDQISFGIEQRRKARRKEVEQEIPKTVEYYNKAIEDLRNKQKTVTTKSDFDAFEKQIKNLEKQRNAITGGPKTQAKKTAQTEKDERVKAFSEELDERKRLYEVYERWVLAYGQQSADEQFKGLKERGANYLEFVTNEISRLESMRDVGYSGSLTDTDRTDLDRLLAERSRLLSEAAPIEQFKQQLDDAKESAQSLTEELIALQNIRAGLAPGDTSENGIARLKLLTDREREVLRQRKASLDEFLQSVVGSEQQETAIKARFTNMRAELDSRYVDKRDDTYLAALNRINAGETKALQNMRTEITQTSQGYKELQRIIDLSADHETKLRLDTEKKKLAALEKGTDEYEKQLLVIRQAEDEHRNHSLQVWGSVAGAIGDVGEALSQYDGTLGEIGSTLSGLTSAATQFYGTWKNLDKMKGSDGKMSMDGYAAAAQNVLKIIGGIIEANQKRREAERQFEAERIGFENDYALRLNQQIGANFKDNPFYRDYTGQIDAGVAQYEDAFNKYQEAIAKLEEGKAKEGQKNKVDGKTTLGMVGSGAAAGALIGAAAGGVVFSVPAAAVGAVIGAVGGLVGGLFAKKKKDVYGSLMEMYPDLVTETAEGWAELDVAMAQALITNNQVDAKTKAMLENAIALNEEMANAEAQIRDNMVDLTGQIGENLRNALVEAFKAGDSAAQALRATIGDIIADVATKLLFSKLVGPALDTLVDNMTKAVVKGDGSLVGVLADSEEYLLPAVENYQESLKAIQEWAASKGFNILGGGTGGKDSAAMEGRIQGVTQESVSVLIGQFNAVRIYQAQLVNLTQLGNVALDRIAVNTSYNSNLVLLIDVVDRLERINNTSIRGFGL